MLIRRIRYNPQTSVRLKYRSKQIIIDIGKIVLYLVIIFFFLSVIYKIFFLDISNKSESLLRSMYNILTCTGFFIYIYFSVIIGLILAVFSLCIYLLSFFLYGNTFISFGFIAIISLIFGIIYYTFIKHVYPDGTPLQ